jgi:hypothetical protein
MTAGSIAEVAGAVALLAAGIVAYRRGGSQGAVLMFAVAAILAIHGLGLMHYLPLPGERGQ